MSTRHPDPIIAVLRELAGSGPRRAVLPDSVHGFLDHWDLSALALLDVEPGGRLRFRAVRCRSGRGWLPGAPLPFPADRVTATLLSEDGTPLLHEPGLRDPVWEPVLVEGGYRRGGIVPLRAGAAFPALLAARLSARPLPKGARGAVVRLAACLGVADVVPERAVPERGQGELGFLLDVSRKLAQAPDFEALGRVIEEAVDSIVEWRAVALLPGSGAPEAARLSERGGLEPAARSDFHHRLQRAAREAGLRFDEPSPERPSSTRQGKPAGSEPLILTLPRRGATGLLAILPAPGRLVGEGGRRLLAGMAQQSALAIDRLGRVADREQQRMAAVLDALPCGVVLVDGRGLLRQLNPAARGLLSHLLGAEPAPDIPWDGLPLPDLEAAAREEIEFCSRGDQRVYACRAAGLGAAAEDGARVAVITDVTEDRLRRDQAMQAEKMFALGELIAGVAHELNNPLASVIGYAQLLLRQPLDGEAGRRVRIIGEEADRCRRIVHNLLEVARSRPAEVRPVDLNDVCRNVLDLFSYPLRVDGVEVSWLPDPELPLVAGDRHRLQQVVINLVHNAQDALRRAPGRRALTVRTGADGRRVRVEVSDSGPGIPAVHLDRIFEPFFTTKEAGRGTGLGLALSARIAREHGGGLRVRSRTDEGAVFTLDLPPSTLPAAPRESPAPAVEPAGRRVLVVDDEPAFRALLEEALSERGYEVRTAADGLEAEALLRREAFDAVVSDLRMPGLDGPGLLEAAARVRPELASRFVFTTGDVASASARRALERGGIACLPKPFGLEELMTLLARLPEAGKKASGPVVDSAPAGGDETPARVD